MAYTFDTKPTATIKGKMMDNKTPFSIAGTNPSKQPSACKFYLDKLFDIVGGQSVAMAGMTRVQISEVIDNG